ncbi:hypothetical protein GCM10010844_27890 [Deinococcus radiotolerans]|uniref:Uncharacterized protein n=1 Tax=Deinococcus radiotolerans TaxID=1309407 RepID=A0ABQ2FMC6_9DEIO|nr:hypothetical protein GCM10010844_27890 [Deinococcus radiotolerans]
MRRTQGLRQAYWKAFSCGVGTGVGREGRDTLLLYRAAEPHRARVYGPVTWPQ